jgi:hypothetical protein
LNHTTKSPWKHVKKNWNEVVVGGDDTTVCIMPTLWKTDAQNKANLNLICAAHEMLLALESARDFILQHDIPNNRHLLIEINRVLRKAK